MLFLLKALIYLGYKEDTLRIIKKDDRLLSIRVYFPGSTPNTTYFIEFRDSYALLPNSLKDLGEAFSGDMFNGCKLDFEHAKINQSNYYTFKSEIEKYLHNVVELTSKVLYYFPNLIYNDFNIDPLGCAKCITIAQLGMVLFRSKYSNPTCERAFILLSRQSLKDCLSKAFLRGVVLYQKPYI